MKYYGYKHWTLEERPRCFNVGKGRKIPADEIAKRSATLRLTNARKRFLRLLSARAT